MRIARLQIIRLCRDLSRCREVARRAEPVGTGGMLINTDQTICHIERCARECAPIAPLTRPRIGVDPAADGPHKFIENSVDPFLFPFTVATVMPRISRSADTGKHKAFRGGQRW